MDNKPKIYTKGGDLGETSLCDGSRTPKDSQRVEAYGTIDELNAFIGLCVVKMDDPEIRYHFVTIQKDLHTIGANLSFPADLSQSSIDGQSFADSIPRITEEDVKKLEKWIDKYDIELPVLKHFILCGGTELSANIQISRVVCRRAEREVVRLKHHEEVNRHILKYLNRLSDYLFTAARLITIRAGKEDVKWIPGQDDPSDLSKRF